MHPRVGREGHGKWRLLVLEDVIVDEEKILLPVVTGLKGLLISLNQATAASPGDWGLSVLC